MESLWCVPCIQKFNIYQAFPRFQNGLIIVFYYYLFSLSFCECASFIFYSNRNTRKTSITCKLFIASIFFNIGYHLDPTQHQLD